LQDAPREQFSSSWEYIKDMPKVAFKTGTSAHAKDLLSIGYSPKYTVAVWFGNFDGKAPLRLKGQEARTGRNTASPSLLHIFSMLKPKDNLWFEKPKNLMTQHICQDAIQIGKCQNSIDDTLIKGVKVQMPCEVLRAEVLAKVLVDKGIKDFHALKTQPCYEKWKNYKPLITHPINKQHYIQNKALPQSFKKTPLQCYAFENNSTIYWLIDNEEPLKSLSGKKTYYYLSEGKHQISCLDQGAKMSKVEVFMEEL
jgi:penicillin-binding protein 1C